MKKAFVSLLKLPFAKREAFVRKVALFCLSDAFYGACVDFMDANADEFESAGGEYKLEHTDIHRRFCDTFETQIADYIEKQGYSVADFYKYCKAADDLGDESIKGFIVVFLSSFDFQTFADLMSSKEKRCHFAQIMKGYRAMLQGGK